uniref:hypothetical protein n=1 Tax=Sphingomonas bacterium TaxID=1895847 RepID=UPI00262A240C|nr:hypothetical protein [Sphingomonas bacterium]
MVAFSVSFCAALLAICTSYVVSRRRSPWGRVGVRTLALAAYGLPSIFLVFGLLTMLLNVTDSPLVRVWLIHFFYIFPMSLIIALGYATSHSMRLDRSAALDGAVWWERLWLTWRAHLWRGHVAIFSIGALISWGDIVFSRQLLPTPSRLLADLYIYRYFDLDTTVPDYPAAAMFSLVLTLLAAVLATFVAITSREGAR